MAVSYSTSLLTRRGDLIISSVLYLFWSNAMPSSQARLLDDQQRTAVARQLGASFGDRLVPSDVRRGRGAASNATGRFEIVKKEDFDDGWESDDEIAALKTEVTLERPRTIITKNESPDISFDRSINPYRGCEHGCVYCYARPTHAYLGLSPGLDFESKLFVKDGAAALLEKELAAPKYRPRVIALGANTDAYQPIERQYRVTRSILEVLARARHPVGIVTKSNLILRDLDLLAPMARAGPREGVRFGDDARSRNRAKDGASRADALPPAGGDRAARGGGRSRRRHGAPIIPAVNDAEIEKIWPGRTRRARAKPAT